MVSSFQHSRAIFSELRRFFADCPPSSRLRGTPEEPPPDPSSGTSFGVAGFGHEHGYFSDVEESDESDSEYLPPESWKKEIRVGAEYQAEVPEGTLELQGGHMEAVDEDDWQTIQRQMNLDPGRSGLLWRPVYWLGSGDGQSECRVGR